MPPVYPPARPATTAQSLSEPAKPLVALKRSLARNPRKVQPQRMKTPTHSERTKTTNAPAAKVSIRIGKRTTFDASVTSAGLLSVGALVSSILLSSAVIVAAAGRKSARRPLALPDHTKANG
ncbi:hypothetical protein C8J41_104135 [Sphingomonas sp. PP-CC-3G-468]|nr:hypothetical protein C8J39_2901 [Sphingomonas sp. PP-CC-1A-547]TCM06712.1 hypothetical protein C8J41_104135 [Sphingomonas sp. PP-CC-3G-468]